MSAHDVYWALSETEERLWATLECAPVGIAHVDPDGRWQLVNKRLCDLLGYSRDELLADSSRHRFDIGLELGGQAARECHPRVLERRYVRKDGSPVWCRVTLAGVCDADLRPKYYVIIFEDVSERMATEGMLGAAAHELRLPLSHMKGFISTLRRTDTSWDSSTQAEFLAEAEHEANRLEHLIEDLLDHTAEDCAAPPRRVTVSPRAVVNASLRRVRAELAGRHVQVDVSSTLPLLMVDATAIERVLVNLLHNACKYSPRGTPIAVVARIVGGMLEISVDDIGPGVPPAESERIFEPFFRRGGQAHQQAGHGLGLAICRSIVTAHGGRIWVVQRPGGGARFTFALPLKIPTHARSRRRSRGECVGRRSLGVD